MFRPCKRANVRFNFEPVDDKPGEGGGGDESSSYKIHVGVKYLFSYSIRVLLITFLTVVPGVLVGLVVYCGRGAMWLGRHRCHTRASGFCVEVLPVDICTVSVVGSMVIVCGESVKTKCVLTCLSGYHIGSRLSRVCCGMNPVQVAYENVVSGGGRAEDFLHVYVPCCVSLPVALCPMPIIKGLTVCIMLSIFDHCVGRYV
jgi:hypothetical protein